MSLYSRPIQMFARVGSLEAAHEAKRIYTDIYLKRTSRSVFQDVLRAYRLAALMEGRIDARTEAAVTAIGLLKDRVTFHGDPSAIDPKGASHAIVLETINNAGGKAMSERTAQAESLLKVYFGESVFDQVVNFRHDNFPPPDLNMALFETLLIYYAKSGGRNHKELKQAQNILECAEYWQPQVTTDDNSLHGENEKRVFPNTGSYNAILEVIRASIVQLRNCGTAKRKALLNAATLATSFLDRMDETRPPNIRTFELLLDIWAIVELPESAKRAEEILSRMSIQQACSAGPSHAWSDSSRVYSHFLHCLATSPDASSAETLQRALRLLNKMEAESGNQYLPSPHASQEEKDIFDSIYETNKMESYKAAYNGALEICSLCEEDSETAFQSAFDVYNRMIAAGVAPDEDTFTYLFATCFLPGKDDAATARRRDLAQTVIAFASDHGVNTSHMTDQLRTSKMQKKRKQGRVRKREQDLGYIAKGV